MRVTDVQVSDTARGARLSATVRWDRLPRQPSVVEYIYRGFAAEDIRSGGDALAAAVLAPAAVTGEDVRIDAPVSEQLLANMRKIVDIWRSWRPGWHRVHVDAPATMRADESPTLVASFFSGGIDSFFTALAPRREEIDALLSLVAFREPRQPEYQLLLPTLAEAAHEMDKDHLVCETNAFDFGLPVVPGWFHLGPILASAVLGLGGRVRRCYIASGRSYRFMEPSGTHPLVDHLWSTEKLEIVHDGAEYIRYEKIKKLSHSDVVLRHLSVCDMPREQAGNCRICDKCQYTGLVLHQEGTLERCRTLGPVTPQSVRRMIVNPIHVRMFELVRAETTDPRLAKAITAALRKARLKTIVRPLTRIVRRYVGRVCR